DAREKLVQMSSAYFQNSKSQNGISANLTEEVAKKIQEDVTNANHILGLGSWLPDTVRVKFDTTEKKNVFIPQVDRALLVCHSIETNVDVNGNTFYTFTFWEKLGSFFLLFFIHFWGFVVTALAISLGAPFWFDILNKLMKLRTSIKVPTNSTEGMDNSVSPLNRVG
ncbi:MAG TPA: hypothetical protein PL108_07660, partial [Sediminibacterium sp.]|nr:hypothetical protein [Sediminibacterium sp.]